METHTSFNLDSVIEAGRNGRLYVRKASDSFYALAKLAQCNETWHWHASIYWLTLCGVCQCGIAKHHGWPVMWFGKDGEPQP